jgi:hypothetical protein
MTIYGPNGQRVMSDKYGGVTYLPNPEAVRGARHAKESLNRYIGKWEGYRRMVVHPTMGMAAKGWSKLEIDAALRKCDDMLQFYLDLLEGW